MNHNSHSSFCFHPNTTIRSGSTAATQAASVQTHNGIVFIEDADCFATLNELEQAVAKQYEFCIHSPSYAPASNNSEPTSNTPYFQCISSGTSGQPKRVRRTHQSWTASFEINAKIANITSRDSYAIIGRLSHSISLYAALEAAYLGADIHALTELRVDKQLQSIIELGTTTLYATPSQLRLLCKNANTSKTKHAALRNIFSGGGKLDEATYNTVQSCFPNADIREFYGATETSFIAMCDGEFPPGSVGKAYPGVDIDIRNTTAAGDGEIWVKSPYLFDSYVEENTELCDNGYFNVGEIGYINGDGFLFLAGRQTRRVNVADTLVYPEAVETILSEHPAVRLCAAVPVPDKARGQVLVAMVEAQDTTAATDELKQELLVFLRQQLGTLLAPRDILFSDSLPLLESGKPDLLTIEALINNP